MTGPPEIIYKFPHLLCLGAVRGWWVYSLCFLLRTMQRKIKKEYLIPLPSSSLPLCSSQLLTFLLSLIVYNLLAWLQLPSKPVMQQQKVTPFDESFIIKAINAARETSRKASKGLRMQREGHKKGDQIFFSLQSSQQRLILRETEPPARLLGSFHTEL